MRDNYTPPKFELNAFNCPHCHAYAKQKWENLNSDNQKSKERFTVLESRYTYTYKTFRTSCENCDGECLWVDEKMIFPDTSHAPFPNDDLSREVKKIYNEAARVLSKSPRSATALLRLALEKLCKEQGKKNKSLKENVDFLIDEKDLPLRIRKAMETVRIIGNEAVHPGLWDPYDNIKTAKTIFKLINIIANKLISEPKEFDSLYDALLDSKKQKDTQ